LIRHLALAAAGAAGLGFAAAANPYWALGFLGLALLYGSASSYVASRGLYYLAAVAPHSSLLAIGVSALLASALPGAPWRLLAPAIGSLPVLAALAAVQRGASVEAVASWLTALTASLGVLAASLAPLLGGRAPLAEALLGDPLLVGPREAVLVAAAGALLAAAGLRYHWLHAYRGVDPEDYRLSGSPGRLAGEAAGVASVLAATVGVAWYTGFVLQHILLLIPALAASRLSASSREALAAAFSVSLASSGLGIAAAIALNVPPSGAAGLAAVAAYAVLAALGRGAQHTLASR
jgi:ABC-type Mn2+/Zn2+ transport system permease subunit